MDAGNGGSGAHAGTIAGGGSAAGGATSAGAAGLGPPSAGGGGAPSAGSSGGDPPGGASGNAGQGEAGAGNAPGLECDGKYVECGCGCCGTEPPTGPGSASCYYPELGENLAAIEAADQAAAMDSSCANAGCSRGVERLCCIAPADAGPAVYEATGYSGDADQFSITRTDADDRCTRAQFTSPHLTPSELPLQLPTNWALQGVYDCGGRSETVGSIGATGSLAFTSTDPCTASFDFTAFLLSSGGEVEAVRFQSEAELSGLLWCNPP